MADYTRKYYKGVVQDVQFGTLEVRKEEVDVIEVDVKLTKNNKGQPLEDVKEVTCILFMPDGDDADKVNIFKRKLDHAGWEGFEAEGLGLVGNEVEVQMSIKHGEHGDKVYYDLAIGGGSKVQASPDQKRAAKRWKNLLGVESPVPAGKSKGGSKSSSGSGASGSRSKTKSSESDPGSNVKPGDAEDPPFDLDDDIPY